eukprot:TRINITY_DN30096_c0_g3_i1.p1 TRINITY_DN30096_c0_g3~~TRINITY_DN30096_c0_g3_i1.p1  ORF type:complete len:470 (+),score=78.05 TRINITY_DN30096_c0_g3_i1:142-1551(+)
MCNGDRSRGVRGDPRNTNLAHFHKQHVEVGDESAISNEAATGPDCCVGAVVATAAAEGDVLHISSVPSGSFTEVRWLARAIHGNVYVYRWRTGRCLDKVEAVEACDTVDDAGVTDDDEAAGERVAVKRLVTERIERNREKERNERNVHLDCRRNAPDPEDSLTEIGVLSYLAERPDLPQYLLKMLGLFADGTHTWLVTEYAEGGELFSLAAAPTPLVEAEVKSYGWMLLQAVAYLHKHKIGHRDISLENILLRNGNIRLMDFGMAVQSHSDAGVPLRYYRMVGKDFYRAPECYVPSGADARVVAPPFPAAGEVASIACGAALCEVKLPPTARPGQICMAELWGYAAAPADVFSVAVCIFILAWQSPPWHRALLSDPSFVVARNRGDNGLEALLKGWRKRPMAPEAMQLLGEMVRSDPRRRPSALGSLASPWFATYAGKAVPVHASATAVQAPSLAAKSGGSTPPSPSEK